MRERVDGIILNFLKILYLYIRVEVYEKWIFMLNAQPFMDQIRFRRFLGHNLRYAFFVYLVIGNFFDDPFLK